MRIECIAVALMRLALAGTLCGIGVAQARAPDWLRDLAQAALPAHDEKTDAVVMYSETLLVVQPKGGLRQRTRVAYRILRADGESRGIVRADYGSNERVTGMHGWSIPAQGKEFDIGMREAVESAVLGVDGSDLISDARTRMMLIPGAHPGALIGYEIEMEMNPLQPADVWRFQWVDPVREARYDLQLPDGWNVVPAFINHPEVTPSHDAAGRWSWVLRDVPAIKPESGMPSFERVAGGLSLALIPPEANGRQLSTWRGIGQWFSGLARDRLQASAPMRQKVEDLTKGAPDALSRIRAIARFAQSDIRYVAIELGIGGHQPHAAAETFANRYGDCKDKVALMVTMLREAGFESYFLIVNTDREALVADSAPTLWFNHMIIAVRLPQGTPIAGLHSFIDHPTLGRLLIFDPTDEVAPVGRLGGHLQSGFGLLVTPEGGEFLQLPRVPQAESGLRREAVLKLDAHGMLSGEITESYTGDWAADQREAVRGVNSDKDLIRPLERTLAASLANFQIDKVDILNRATLELPFVWHFNVKVKDYARDGGELLMVRPRIIGLKASSFLETSEARVHDIVIDEARTDTDHITITVPPGMTVESLPAPQAVDLGFVAYRSSTEFKNDVLTFQRTLEHRDLRIPAAKADAYRQLLRTIARDERTVAIFKKSAR